MSNDGFGTALLLITVAGITAVWVKTWGAPPEAQAAGTWSGGILLGLAALLALVRVYARGRR